MSSFAVPFVPFSDVGVCVDDEGLEVDVPSAAEGAHRES